MKDTYDLEIKCDSLFDSLKMKDTYSLINKM